MDGIVGIVAVFSVLLVPIAGVTLIPTDPPRPRAAGQQAVGPSASLNMAVD